MNESVIIESVKQECYDTKTFTFKWVKECRPGQFVMVWIPGVDEIPMSLSSTECMKSITVKAIGDATKRLHELNKGDRLFIRGPYGNGFTEKKRMLIVAGGVGMAAVMPMIRRTGADVVLGARTSKDLVFEEEASMHSKVWISTDDGSKGFHGNAVQLAKKRLDEGRYDEIIGCGPEIMLYYLHKLCVDENVQCQLSLERHMKCGTGVCGACMMDEERVCKDGPVFDRDRISGMKEFGKNKRAPSGLLIPL